jgi:hypothetical protein
MKKCALFLFACLGVMILSGCHTTQGTVFIPLEPKLEPVQLGGAQTMILVNTSGRPLYNVKFRAYMWGNSTMTYTGDNFSTLPQRVPERTYTFQGTAGKLDPGQAIHFTDQRTGGEARILKPVTRVQITGSCDEGPFREDWQVDREGQLRLWQ